MKTVIGVDPGKSGALAAMREDGTVTFLIMPIIDNEIDITSISKWISNIIVDMTCRPLYSVIEKVHSMPQQGVASTFSFGYNTGVLHGILGTLAVPRLVVSPQSWQKSILKDTNRDKGIAIAYVMRMYPELDITPTIRSKKPHSGVADAICIARYGLSIL